MSVARTFDHPAGITGMFFDVHSADECAMAETLVTEIRARRLSAAGVSFCGSLRDGRAMGTIVNTKKNKPDRPTGRKHSPGFPTVLIALRIAFCALAIVLAPAAFRSPAQGLAL
jgi:hypothetical protein